MLLRAAGLLFRRLPGLLQHIVKVVVTVGSKNAVQTAFLCTNVAVLSISTRRLQRARFAASVRVMRDLDEESLRRLLHADLPKWVKFADWERGQHLQSFVALAWPTFNRMICSIIKKEVEERLGRHGEFGRASFSRLSLGKQAPLVLAVKGIPFAGDQEEGGALAMALDIQVEWDGQPDILIQLSGIPGASVAVQLCHVRSLVRVELSPIEDELPFLTGLSLTLVSNPELDFDVRALGGDLTSLPALGSWLKSAVAGIIQERLVWPQTLGWRWGPSWDRQQAAAAGGGAALAAGEAQRRRQLPAPLGVLMVEVVSADLEPRRSTFLGRFKPVSSRVSMLLPPAADPGGPGGLGRASAAARAVVQKGLTSVQAKTCQPLWQQAFPFVVSSRHQVLHLLLSHKREFRVVPMVTGMVQALGVDQPLGSADVAVADILSEAAAQEEWSVQQMLLEAAKLEVAAAAAAAAAAAQSDEESLGDYASADEGSKLLSPSPSMISARSGSLGLGAFASAALAAVAAQEGSSEAAGAAGTPSQDWVRLERREGSAGLGMPPSAAALATARRQQASWQQRARQGTPPPRSLSARLERRSGGSSGGEGSPAPGRPVWAARPDDAGWQGSGRWRRPGATPPPPLSLPSWRRSATRSPSPDRGRMLGTAALLDPAALMQLQMEQRAPDMKWLSDEGVWVEVPSADVMTLGGLLAQAAVQTSDAAPETPRSGGSDDDGWLGRLRGYILGRVEGEDEDDEFIPTKAPLAGRVKLRLTWQPVEREPLPATLWEAGAGQEERHAQQQAAPPAAVAEQQQQQQQQARGHSRSGSQLPAASAGDESVPSTARRSLQLPRGTGSGPEAAKSAPAALQTGQPPGGGADGGTPTQGGMAAAAAAAALAAAADSLTPQPGVLAVRVANTKLEYVTAMSCPVLAVSIDRRPTPEQAEAAAPLGASPTKLPRSAPPSAAGSPAGAAAGAAAPAAGIGAAPPQMAEAAAASAASAAQAAHRWISMESTPGSRMGSLHWGQVFYIPASLSPADCQEGRLLVELGEVASTARYTLFGPALYALDASDSFKEDVTVVAAAAVPLRRLLQQHRASLRAQLREATPGVAEADRLVVGEADVQLGWFPLQEPLQQEAAAPPGQSTPA